MKTNGSLGTNAILRLILNDVPAQTDAVTSLVEQGGALAINDIAIIETVFVLHHHYGFHRAQINKALTILMKVETFNLNRPLIKEALKWYVDKPSLSFEDCCLVAAAKIQNTLPLWTFDQKLARQTKGLAKELTSHA